MIKFQQPQIVLPQSQLFGMEMIVVIVVVMVLAVEAYGEDVGGCCVSCVLIGEEET
jgi:hypothetical protein